MKAEPNKVIEEIIQLRLKNGYSSTSLVNYLKETYDINQARAYELIKEARVVMGEVYNEINTDPIKDSILVMENMLQKALGEGEMKIALDIQKELNKVNQLYVERTEIKHTGSLDIRNLFGFDDEEKKDNSSDDKTQS
jgi:hypothetical protein